MAKQSPYIEDQKQSVLFNVPQTSATSTPPASTKNAAGTTSLPEAQTSFAESTISGPQQPATAKAESSDTSAGEELASGALSMGGNWATNFLADREAGALGEYQNNLGYWLDQQKYWFDPNSDSAQDDLDVYLDEMPKETDALLNSSLTAGLLSENDALGDIIIGPPMWFADDEETEQQFEYMYHKGGEGAIAGTASGGWVGAIVGGVLGLVEGALGWEDAERKDAENKRRAREEYNRRMDEWTKARELKARKANEALDKERIKFSAAQAKAKTEEQKAKLTEGLSTRRANMSGMIDNAIKAKQANRQSRTAMLN